MANVLSFLKTLYRWRSISLWIAAATSRKAFSKKYVIQLANYKHKLCKGLIIQRILAAQAGRQVDVGALHIRLGGIWFVFVRHLVPLHWICPFPIAYWHCPFPIAHRHCSLTLPIANTHWPCPLILPIAIAYCNLCSIHTQIKIKSETAKRNMSVI